jgi:hypothetical protein
MTTLQALVTQAREQFRDPARSFFAQVATDGVTRRFDLPVTRVDATSLQAFYDDDQNTLLSGYDVDEEGGVITFDQPLEAGRTLDVQGNFYQAFITSEIEQQVATAFALHTKGRVDAAGAPLTYDTLPPIEEYLVVLLARIELLWIAATDAAREIDVVTPDGVSIPRSQRFQQIMQLIMGLENEYRQYAEALNVGPFRIEVYTLRRVSRATNRLVPVYVAQEYDDVAPPTRVLPPIDPGI